MQATEELIRDVVRQVLAEMSGPSSAPSNGAVSPATSYTGRYGIFTCVDQAVAAATEAFEQLSQRTLEDRKRIIDHIRA
jgi:aldehyde dehydrogenase